MKKQYKNIVRYFDIINHSLFRIDGKLSYKRTLKAFKRLVEEIEKVDTEEDVWCLGETGETTLDNLLVGAYWFLTDHHGGQDSLEYEVQCVIGRIFNPGMSCLEEDSGEKAVYEQLEQLHNRR